MISDKHGFTLIELSIVLVIIGLIVGGVLVGRDLIHAAELRKVVTQYEQLDTTVNTFRTKYNCLPGDCSKASQFFTGATNGNGNDIIEALQDQDDGGGETECSLGGLPTLTSTACGGTSASGITNEGPLMWEHLSQAHLVPVGAFLLSGQGNQIVNKTNAMTVLGSAAMNLFVYNIPTLGHIIGTGENYNNASLYAGTIGDGPYMYPQDVQTIDGKIDDGLPFTGRVRGAYREYDSSQLYQTYKCTKVDGGGTYTINQYDPTTPYTQLTFANNILGCSLLIKAGF